MVVSFKEEFRCSNFLFHYSQSYKFTRSQWRIPQWLYLVWRLCWAAWHFAWIVCSIKLATDRALYAGAGAKWLIYLSNHSYLLLTIQSILHLVVVIRHIRRNESSGSLDSVQGSIQWYLKALWLLTTAGFDSAIIVTAVYWFYWSLVFKELNSIVTVMVHGVNSLYVLLDIFIIATPVRLLHFIHPVIYGAAYIIFTVIYHVAHGTGPSSEPYIYKVLDWSSPGPAIGVSLGILLVAIPLIHLLQFGLYILRVYILETCRCCKSCPEVRDDACRCCRRLRQVRVQPGNEEIVERV